MKSFETSILEPGKDVYLVSSVVANVASIPLRSPFRYPGGKTWLVPYIRMWMNNLGGRPHNFIEPFAGGGIVGLTVAFENLADKVTLVELDDDVAAVWKTILTERCEDLIGLILSFNLTETNLRQELEVRGNDTVQHAFQTILRNRTLHSGILAKGSAFLKYGEDGKGLSSRWYPRTLAKRLSDIYSIRHKIEFVHGDGLRYIEEHIRSSENVFFMDPPYTAGGKRAGARLYTHHELDHEKLFRLCSRISGNFLMTYDFSPEVLKLAETNGFEVAGIPMKGSHHRVVYELLVSKDLGWVKRPRKPHETKLTEF